MYVPWCVPVPAVPIILFLFQLFLGQSCITSFNNVTACDFSKCNPSWGWDFSLYHSTLQQMNAEGSLSKHKRAAVWIVLCTSLCEVIDWCLHARKTLELLCLVIKCCLIHCTCWCGVKHFIGAVSISTRLWASQCGVGILLGPRDFSLPDIVQTGSGAHYGVVPWQ